MTNTMMICVDLLLIIAGLVYIHKNRKYGNLYLYPILAGLSLGLGGTWLNIDLRNA